MKEKPQSSLEEDTEEMRKWRGLSQSEMDLCWKNLAERMEEDVLEKYKVEETKKRLSELVVLYSNGGGYEETRDAE